MERQTKELVRVIPQSDVNHPEDPGDCNIGLKITEFDTANSAFKVDGLDIYGADQFKGPELVFIPSKVQRSEPCVREGKITVAYVDNHSIYDTCAQSHIQNEAFYNTIEQGDYLVTWGGGAGSAAVLFKPSGVMWGINKRDDFCLKCHIYQGISEIVIKWPWIYVARNFVQGSVGGPARFKLKNATAFKVMALIKGSIGMSRYSQVGVRRCQFGRDYGGSSKSHSSNHVKSIKVDGSDNVYCCGEEYNDATIFKYNSGWTLLWKYKTTEMARFLYLLTNGDCLVSSVACYDEDTLNDSIGEWAVSTYYGQGTVIEYDSDYFECLQNHTSDAEEPWVNRPKVGSNWQAYWKCLKANLRKISWDGNLLWRVNIHDTDQLAATEIFGIVVDATGYIYVAGDKAPTDSVHKLTSGGSILLGYNTGDIAYAIKLNSESDLIVCGDTGTDEDAGLGSLRKLSTGLVKDWHSNPSSDACLRCVDIDLQNDNIYAGNISGWSSKGLGKFDTDGTLLKTWHVGSFSDGWPGKIFSVSVWDGFVLFGCANQQYPWWYWVF